MVGGLVRIDELRRAIREFVPVGGLLAWMVQVRCRDSLAILGDPRAPHAIHVTATVPDSVTGRNRQIEYVVPVSSLELERRQAFDPYLFLRDIIRDFVVHESDEGTGFREFPRPSAVAWSETTPSSAPTVSDEVRRPFDPHRPEQISAEALREYMRTGKEPARTGT
jgi:hypothetical protein